MFRYLLALLFFSGFAVATELQPAPSTVQAPQLVLPDIAGKTVSLKAFRGKVVLVNFWASWCPPCREEMPSIWRLYRKVNHDDFVVLLVNVGESLETIKAFLPQKIQQDLVSLSDSGGKVAQSWNASALPHSFLVDKNGSIHYQYRGAKKWDASDYVALVNKLLE